jgi:hypothetical protein
MDGKDYEFDGETYVHTDKATGTRFRWNLAENRWDPVTAADAGSATPPTPALPKGGPSGDPAAQHDYRYENGVAIFTDPNDGAEYEWDNHQKAWTPRVSCQNIYCIT